LTLDIKLIESGVLPLECFAGVLTLVSFSKRPNRKPVFRSKEARL